MDLAGFEWKDQNVIGNMTIGEYKKKWMDAKIRQEGLGMRGYNQYESKLNDGNNEAIKIINEANKTYSLKPTVDFVKVCKALETNHPSLDIDSRKSFTTIIQLHKDLSKVIIEKLMQIRSHLFGQLKDDKKKHQRLLLKETLTDEESNLIRPIQAMEREQKEWDAKYKMFINRSMTDVRNLKKETFKKMEAADIPKALMDLGMSDLSWEIEKVYTYSRKPIEEEECTEEKGAKREEKYYCIGRFSCHSIQCMSKVHRGMIFGDYVELDLSLAGPSAFLDLGQFFFQNMDLRSLKWYITDSEIVRAEIINENKNFIDANPQIKHNRMTEDKKKKTNCEITCTTRLRSTINANCSKTLSNRPGML